MQEILNFHVILSVGIVIFINSGRALCGSETTKLMFHSSQSDSSDLHDAEVQVYKESTLLLKSSTLISESVILHMKYEEESNKEKDSTTIINVTIHEPLVQHNDSSTWTITVIGENAGHVTLVAKITPKLNTSNTTYDTSEAFVRFQVYRNHPLVVFSDVIGWFYFVAWSVSFYPQVYLNFRRKSVVGLNFDFLTLNFMGFLCYSAYNVGLFWIKPVLDEFRDKNPHDIVPVEINDVIFALHALLLTIITLVQVFIYEKGGQKVSIPAIVILGACTLAVVVLVIVAAVPSVTTFKWLEMVSGLSYVKLAITIIKYIPQAYMNFRRKSTVGWSIGNVLLDFTGGSCSIIQMFILAYNYNDWKSIFLNPVKFWLGALSIFFDIVFIVQHYCLYRFNNQMLEGYQSLNDEKGDQSAEVQS